MKRLFKSIASFFRRMLFKKKTRKIQIIENENSWTFLEHDMTDPDEDKKLSHTSIALNIIRKHFLIRGKFTSNQLYCLIQIEGFVLTRKQVWRVIYKLQTMHLIHKVVLCSSDPKSAPFYEISTKLKLEWKIEN